MKIDLIMHKLINRHSWLINEEGIEYCAICKIRNPNSNSYQIDPLSTPISANPSGGKRKDTFNYRKS